MSFSSDNEVALSVLRKYDSQCQDILDSCNKVKIHNFDKSKNSWVMQDQLEGALYLVKRVISPLYKFVILSKYNKPGSFPLTTDIPISQYYVSQSHQQYYMFKNESGLIQAIMFQNKTDCERICSRVERIIMDLKFTTEKVNHQQSYVPRSNFPASISGDQSQKISQNLTSEDSKIINLLEQARKRYNEGHVDSVPISTSTPDRRSRQIDINELFTTGCTTNVNGPPNSAQQAPKTPTNTTMVNMGSSYTAKTNTCRSISIDNKEDANTTLTVTELEKSFAQGAMGDNDDDDDVQLLNPQMLMGANKGLIDEVPLSKEQLKEAMIQMLQNDDDGGVFLTRLHSAYVDLCRKKIARK